jgi:hypothetical protein
MPVAEAGAVIERVDAVRDRRRRVRAFDNEHGAPVDDIEIEL